LKAIRYNDCEGVDCLSRKGAVLLQGEVAGKAFQLIGTHLQSSGPQLVRSKQCRQIHDELQAPYQSENVLQIICGDFNTNDSDSSSYNTMIKILGAEDGAICGDVCNTYKGIKDRIDYIFVRRNGTQVKRILRDVHLFHYAWKGQRK
jgi:endonuclease/exonuclease/phosphatase family metal-dependent hydrolase